MVSLPKTFIAGVALVFSITAISSAQDADSLRHRVLQMSHATRINEPWEKPWHMRVNFQLYDEKGKASESGELEEWWAGLQLWKITIQSPSYSGTTLENQDGDFRTTAAGLIPVRIRALEAYLVYPAPMTEDLSGLTPHLHHLQSESAELDCIQLTQPVPPGIPIYFANYCLDSKDDSLKEIYSDKPWRMIRSQLTNFRGQSLAFSIKIQSGKLITESADIENLADLVVESGLFTPTSDMTSVTDLHRVRVVRVP